MCIHWNTPLPDIVFVYFFSSFLNDAHWLLGTKCSTPEKNSTLSIPFIKENISKKGYNLFQELNVYNEKETQFKEKRNDLN